MYAYRSSSYISFVPSLKSSWILYMLPRVNGVLVTVCFALLVVCWLQELANEKAFMVAFYSLYCCSFRTQYANRPVILCSWSSFDAGRPPAWMSNWPARFLPSCSAVLLHPFPWFPIQSTPFPTAAAAGLLGWSLSGQLIAVGLRPASGRDHYSYVRPSVHGPRARSGQLQMALKGRRTRCVKVVRLASFVIATVTMTWRDFLSVHLTLRHFARPFTRPLLSC